VSVTASGEEGAQVIQRVGKPVELVVLQPGEALAEPGPRSGIACGKSRAAGISQAQLDTAAFRRVLHPRYETGLHDPLDELGGRRERGAQMVRYARKAGAGVAPDEEKEPELSHGEPGRTAGAHLFANGSH